MCNECAFAKKYKMFSKKKKNQNHKISLFYLKNFKIMGKLTEELSNNFLSYLSLKKKKKNTKQNNKKAINIKEK